MVDDQTWSNRVVLAASMFAGFGIAYLIDDFLYGVPAEFNLSNATTQALGLAFFAALTGLATLAGRGSRKSYLGFVIIGGLLALADVLKHLPEVLQPGSWRSGVASETFSIGLIASGLVAAIVSGLEAWKADVALAKARRQIALGGEKIDAKKRWCLTVGVAVLALSMACNPPESMLTITLVFAPSAEPTTTFGPTPTLEPAPESTHTPNPTVTPKATDAPKPTNTPEMTNTPEPTLTPPPPGEWGRLANPGFWNGRIKTTLFFSGQARDGSSKYGCNPVFNMGLYTVHPVDARHLTWSDSVANRDFALDQMVEAGINVVSMSSWGEDFLPCDIGWAQIAPMQTAPGSHDELFANAVGKPLLIVPFIESRNDWAFRDEFPRWTDGRVAPGTVSQINNLINRYLKNAAHPEWADQWAQVYGQNGEPCYAVVIIHASSNRLGANDHAAFAAGFDLVAEEVWKATGVKVGFFIDPLPPGSNAPGVFRPSPEKTGPVLLGTDAILGIQSFIPEIWVSGAPDDAQLMTWKRDFSQRWSGTGVPFLMDIFPGYDASIVFPGSITYGFTQEWRNALTAMVADYGQDGLVFNSWNGYTEGMAAVPTHEHGDTYYRWLQAACELAVGVE